MKQAILFSLLLIFKLTTVAGNIADSNYVESPVTLHTERGDLFGTMTLPVSFKTGPVALIIAGSGPTDRDGNNTMMKNNSLLQMAHELAGKGIASLRYDKRGIGASVAAGIKEKDLRFDDFMNDAKGWLTQLKKDKRFVNISVIGHSEGSLLGMMAANGMADKFISVSGPGQSADILIKQQLITQPQGIKDQAYKGLDSLKSGQTITSYNPMLGSLFRPSIQRYLISWFAYDPQVEIKKLTIPVMIIQGTTDIQVSVDDANRLAKAKPEAKLLIVENMNHVLKIADSETQENIKTYNDPSLQIPGIMIGGLSKFILGK